MLRTLLASTAVLAIATPALAKDITTATTVPLLTSKANGNTAEAIHVKTGGSITLPAPAVGPEAPNARTAITMDTNHEVTNAGTITVSNMDNARGIVATDGRSGNITNTGTIALEESYTPTDSDKDGDLDGPYAQGNNKIAIETQGAFTGNVSNSGVIKIKGNNSTGIKLGGDLTGGLKQDGTITVLGDNAVGVSAGKISGDVRLAGTVTAQGQGAVGANFADNIGGTLVVQGAITSTGYRYTTPPADPSKLDADDLHQGGSALIIGGDVAKGIVLAVAPQDKDPNDKDEDKDGIEDAKEGNAVVQSFGSAAAMKVGSAERNVAIGAVPGSLTGYGLQIDGGVSGSGLYAGVNGNGLVIGGDSGRTVTIANGVGVSGSVLASSRDADATAFRLGTGAATNVVYNSGTIAATTGAVGDKRAVALQVDAGANLPKIHNTGTIRATLTGKDATGSAIAISDASGTVALVENAGAIIASGANSDTGRNVAIDLSNYGTLVSDPDNKTGATVRQTQVGANFTAPSITGDIKFGHRDDTLDVADGFVTGTTYFGGGSNRLALSGDAVMTGGIVFGKDPDDLTRAISNTITLGGTSVYVGTVDLGTTAGTLTVNGTARFNGSFKDASNLAVVVNGGSFGVNKTSTIGSLNVGASGVLAVTLAAENKDVTKPVLNVAGAAEFANGATLALQLASISGAEGRYTLLTANAIQGAQTLKTTTAYIPYMFDAKVATNSPANHLQVDVSRKTVAQLGLNKAQGNAYDAILAALGKDKVIEDVFLGITNGDVFKYSVSQMLPDHAGGAFEGVSLGSRTFARQMNDPLSPVYSMGGLDIIVNMAGWGSDKAMGETAAYELAGFGGSVAGEVDTKIGAFGLAANWFWNEYDEGGDANRVLSDTYELAAYWRGTWGGLNAFARGSYGIVDFSSRRTFVGLDGQAKVERNTLGEWGGKVTSLTGGLSYEIGSGPLFLRPTVSADYVRLSEEGYTETGGQGLNLTVDKRTSDEFGLNAGLATGIDFIGKGRGDTRWFRTEAEGGWREIVGGSLGETTAHFKDGRDFTLTPEQQAGGWYGRLRVMGGSRLFEIGGEVGAEKRNDSNSYSLRGSIRMGF